AIYVMMLRGYRGKVAVITGAANGLGRALAHALAARGCSLALVDIDKRVLEKATAEIARTGIVVTHHCADVSSEQGLRQVAEEVLSAHGKLHLLINNAAVSGSASFANTGAAAFEQIMRVNFFGAVYGCRVFLPSIQKQGEGQIM